MSTRSRPIALTLMLLLSTLGATVAVPQAGASQVVITEAVQVIDGGTSNDRQAALIADSEGNIHVVWTRSNFQLYYSMLSPRGETLIDATLLSNAGQHNIWNPDIDIDEMDRIHIVWADRIGQHSIKYTVLDPFRDDLDGSAALDTDITLVDDYVVSQRAKNRDWPAIAVDSRGAAHIVWEDSFDTLDMFYAQPQIYYAMITPDYTSNIAVTDIGATLLTPIIGHKGHPDVTVDAEDMVQVVWDDTRGGKVELVFVVDTSGSMYSEWADVCTVIYGGNYAGGGYFMGLKPMLAAANMTVFETIYGLGNTLPSAASSGNCAQHNKANQPWRTQHLDDGDDSGGLRKLPQTIYNGATYSGYSGEDWGPGSNWACLSWYDAYGNVPGNPPSTNDHVWNPNATKIVIPISDEGPKDGDPSQQADDNQAIQEAHDSCYRAGVIPVGMYGQTYGGASNVQSHFRDLVQCPNGVVSTQPRNCPGSTVGNSDAGGQVYEFPSGTGGTNSMALLTEAMVYISTNNSREIYLSVLDPYGKLENDPSFVRGQSATVALGGGYREDVGSGDDGHLVVVNDTRVTIDDAYSYHPSITVDTEGHTHIVWMDGRDYGMAQDANYEVYYTKLNLRGAGDWNGASGGLSTYAIKEIEDTRISDSCETNPNYPASSPFPCVPPQGRAYGGNSVFPAILSDSQDKIHIAWHEFGNATANEEIAYVRLNATDATGAGVTALDPWEIVEVTSWESDKLGPNTGRKPDIGTPPAFANDLGSGAHVAWSDTKRCADESNNNRYTICYTHILTGQVDVFFDVGESYFHVIEPGEQTTYNLTLNNTTPGPADLVADTYQLNVSGLPLNWSATLHFSNNHTTINLQDHEEPTSIFLEGGDSVRIYMRVRAPSIYQANADERAYVFVNAISTTDPAIRSDRLTVTEMDVIHGIDLETSHRMADVEQGQTAIFSITVTNTGNVYDSFAFYDPNTIEGQAEWLLPFGWQINFPQQVFLDPGQSVTKNLEVSVPTGQEPGTFVLYLKGWSEGEPIKDIRAGTFDVLELWVNVSIRSTGNIVFEIFRTSEYVTPGDPNDDGCASYQINVIKNFDPGYIVFSTPGAPEAKPDGVSLADWRQDHWTVDLDFTNAPPARDGTGEIGDPRLWPTDRTDLGVTATVCAPYNADSGLGVAQMIKANLDGFPRVADSVLLSTNVNHVYDLTAGTPRNLTLPAQQASLNAVELPAIPMIEVDPGEEVTVPMMILNKGNGADAYNVRLQRVTDADGVDVLWNVDIPNRCQGLNCNAETQIIELERRASQVIDLVIHVPDEVLAGSFTAVFEVLSEEVYQGTNVQETIPVQIEVQEFHDLRMNVDVLSDNPVKTTAPGKTVTYTLEVHNNGNVPDTPSLHNHTATRDGTTDDWVWNEAPGMGSLSNWQVSWAMLVPVNDDVDEEVRCVEALSTDDSFPEDDCVYLTDINQFRLPEMDPYTSTTVLGKVTVDPNAALTTRVLGLKVMSAYGSSPDGDHDETPSWTDVCETGQELDECDTNEVIVTLRLRAPNLVINSVDYENERANVGDNIPIQVKLANTGNVHATDVEIVLCEDPSRQALQDNTCDEDSIVFRREVGAILAPEGDRIPDEITLTLLYPVSVGKHSVYVMIDPDNTIVESREGDNKGDELDLGSSNPLIDNAAAVVSQTALPVGVILLTISLLGVVYMVGRARRAEAQMRVAEQSSLITVLTNDEEF